jgi:hypothetical protein
MAEASVGGVVATGPRRGRRIVRVRSGAADLDAFVMGRDRASSEGPPQALLRCLRVSVRGQSELEQR